MASIKTHCEDCERILGGSYKEVHEWLDEYAKKYPPQIYFEYHRNFRHNAKAIEHLGFYSKLAAKIHIIRDCDRYLTTPFYKINEIKDIESLFNELDKNNIFKYER